MIPSSGSTARRLLVAVPWMLDPNFARTVVFVVEHTEEGALGVVLDRPSETPVGELLAAWAPWTAPPGVVFVGGPVRMGPGAPGVAGVQGQALIGLGRVGGSGVSDPPDAWQPLLGPVGTVDLGRDPGEVHPGLEEVRVFAGYAGWAPGQLDAELAEGGWYVLDAAPDDLLTATPAGLWRRVLRRQVPAIAVMANHPLDPRSN